MRLLLPTGWVKGHTWLDVFGDGITSIGDTLLGLVKSRLLRVRSNFLLSLAREIFTPVSDVVS